MKTNIFLLYKKTTLCIVLTIIVQITSYGQGTTSLVTWNSSVDGAVLKGNLFIPDNTAPDAPVFIWFNGGSGNLEMPGWMPTQFNARGWHGLVIAGREWQFNTIPELSQCSFPFSNVYFNHPNPNIGPGEQDVLDGVDWILNTYPSLNADKVYISGFSLGGRGAYMMGLKVPDYFAGIAPMAPATDQFEIDINTDPTREGYGCRMAFSQGIPGAGSFSNTARAIQSARFLIENAYNIPIYHGHGTIDTTATNNSSIRPYMHGKHLLTDSTYSSCHACDSPFAQSPCTSPSLQFCFGHTPTLTELRVRHPDGYDFAWMTTPVAHQVHFKWLLGTPISDLSADGVINPFDNSQYIGALEYLSQFSRNSNPETIVYKSYTDYNRRAYWAEINISHPWLYLPGAIRATRINSLNLINVELVRVDTALFDLDKMGLDLVSELTLNIQKLIEPVFDPNLLDTQYVLNPAIVIRSNDLLNVNVANIQVLLDGIPLPNNFYSISFNELTVSPFAVPNISQLKISLSNPLGIESQTDIHVSYYPNPTSGSLTIECEYPIQQIEIRNLNGQIVFKSQTNSSENIEVDLKELVGGMYFLYLKTSQGHIIKKIIKI